jgi:hypothetical protein
MRFLFITAAIAALAGCSSSHQDAPPPHRTLAVPTDGQLVLYDGDDVALNHGKWRRRGIVGDAIKPDTSVAFHWVGLRDTIDLDTGPYGWTATRPEGGSASVMWDYQSQQWIVQVTITIRYVDPVNPAVWADVDRTSTYVIYPTVNSDVAAPSGPG